MCRILTVLVFLMSVAAVQAQIDVGSDGSDGAFNPTCAPTPCTVTIDLSLAATAAWDAPSPVAGQGVYDADQWAVVFKYSSVDVPTGVTVRFLNNASRAPVVWLVQGDAVISGIVNLGGSNGHTNAQARSNADPGPGGFRGGRGADIGTATSAGLGPGGGSLFAGGNISGSYATLGHPSGITYGNSAILPLIGGSGGSGGTAFANAFGGGAGGGAFLLAADNAINITPMGRILALGGIGGPDRGEAGGGGSGGAIRLMADSVQISGQLRASGGIGSCGNFSCGRGGVGRIRVESNSFVATDFGDPILVQDMPTFVFPPPATPRVKGTMVDVQPIPADPSARIDDVFSADVTIATANTVSLAIEGENVPAGTQVEARIVSKSGTSNTFMSSPLVDNGGILTATADVSFAPGFSVVQLRAAFSVPFAPRPGNRLGKAESKSESELRTLNGECIERIELNGTLGNASRVVFVTETGRKIPVGR